MIGTLIGFALMILYSIGRDMPDTVKHKRKYGDKGYF